MSIGVIGYAVHSGIGQMVHQLKKHLGISAHLEIPHNTYPRVPEWGGSLSQTWTPTDDFIRNWVQIHRVRHAISVETFYGPRVIAQLQRLGVKTHLIAMGDWFDPNDTQYAGADSYICTSRFTYDQIPSTWPTVQVPWPVDTEEIPFTLRTGPARKFIHNGGNIGVGGRKGTAETVEAFLIAKPVLPPDATLRVRTQRPVLVRRDQSITYTPSGVANYADLYADGDCMIYPSHLEGQALVVEEALAAGLPSIVTDSPANEFHVELGWKDLLVRAYCTSASGTTNPKALRYHVDLSRLAQIIEHAANVNMEPYSRQARQLIEAKYSWRVLRQRYLDLFN